jgi:hypothetical protein
MRKVCRSWALIMIVILLASPALGVEAGKMTPEKETAVKY